MSRVLGKNIGFMGLSQVANYVFPLLTIPYITRVLGPGNYGLVELANTTLLYFTALVIYGMNVTATREVASHPDDWSKISKLFSKVLHTRGLLLLVAASIYIVMVLLVPKFAAQQKLMWSAFPILVGWVFYPQFLFQGLQKLQFVAVSNFLIKLFSTAAIFIFIQEESDFYLVVLINSFSQILVALALWLYSFRVFPELKYEAFEWTAVQEWLKVGAPVFLSNIFMRVSKFGVILFTGFLLTDEDTGLFAAALKIVVVLHSLLFFPLSAAAFPYLNSLRAKSFDQYDRAFFKVMFLSLMAALLCSAPLFIWSEEIMVIALGDSYRAAAPALEVMSLILVMATFGHFSLNQGLLILRKDKLYLGIILGVGLLSLGLNYYFIAQGGIMAAAWMRLLVESLLAILGAVYYLRLRKQVL